ncbi:MAG: methyltransferase [Chitinophagaceae bacterium]
MNNLDADYWSNRFDNNDTPWDIGDVSTPLKQYFNQLTDKNISILIPGCGNGYEVAYLLENGFTRITVIDISPVLTAALEKKFSDYTGGQLRILTGDFFSMRAKFDLIIEQTFFCALDPSLRKKYAVHIQQLLNENGQLTGLLFDKIFASEGPAFGGSMEEYRQLFSPLFHIKTMAPCYNSIPQRAGTECFFIAQKIALEDIPG